MKRAITALAVAAIAGCATPPAPTVSDAIADFIHVSELEERDAVRTLDQFDYSYLSDQYVILKTRKEKYLVRFRRPCRELNQSYVPPDIRYERNVLRSGFDTIRGCRIGNMYALDETQAQELKNLGKAPGERT